MPVSQTSIDSTAVHQPVDIRAISTSDVFAALSQGTSDFWRHPSHYLFLALIYPLVGIALAVWSTGGDTFALLYPLAAGFALIGPIAGLGLYELSRRREQGLDDHPRHAASVLKHPALGSMLAIGLFLALVFIAWLAAASGLYGYFLGHNLPKGSWN